MSSEEEPWPTTVKEPSQKTQKISKPHPFRQRAKPSANAPVQKARAETNEWELDCEICSKRGVNLVRSMSRK